MSQVLIGQNEEKIALKCEPHTPDTLKAQVTTTTLCHNISQFNTCLGKDWSGKGWENQHPNLSLQPHTQPQHPQVMGQGLAVPAPSSGQEEALLALGILSAMGIPSPGNALRGQTQQPQPPGFAHLLMALRAACAEPREKPGLIPANATLSLEQKPGGRACAHDCTKAGSILWKKRVCGCTLDTSGSSCAEGTEHVASQRGHVPVPIE